ncbi:hypothetical protein CBS9595_000408 [Malassezia furfur]|nr:hypothetical protein CBS9595_000408 [Malassezia furfur]
MDDVDAEFDDALDASVLAQLDALEAANGPADDPLDPEMEQQLLDAFDALDDEVQTPSRTTPGRAPLQARRNTPSGTPSVRPTDASKAPARAAPAPPRASHPASSPAGLTQQGLWGHSYTPTAVESSQGTLSVAPAPPSASTGGFAWTAVKVWDHSIFVHGNRVTKPSGDDEADVLYERRAPLPSPPAERPMKLAIDRAAAQTWIYPVNKPLRTYQLNIVQKALFHNVLVALPTGLGKTFIAAVVILNLFRWFPEGKSTCHTDAVIFVAPTRPLVTQQQQACHSICGLPWDTAIELTGSTRRALRDDEWQTKRIFYMTPQTFENDLLSTTCDPRDVVCVVVDEAHRATGNYAYCKVIRHLMYHNPHFRVLALTATPGSHADKVQEVVNNLHINRIEIRTEDALDIQPYLHTKHEQLVRVPLGDAVGHLRAAWVALMRTFHDPLLKHGVLRNADTGALRSFAVRAAANDAHGRAILAEKPYLRGSITQLSNMALALQYLAEESVRVFCDRAQAIVAPSKGGAKKDQVFSPRNPAFQAYILALEGVQHELVHPKMQALLNVLLDHVAAHPSTRVMVFCSYREVVTEIVALLQEHGLRATPFIGQATDKKGNRGFTQKVQEQILTDFQKGTFQVLVATSIGEEGLDIGEVDLIVCYEAVRDSVRALQRVGRTGRMRDGRIVVLMTEGREEHNWQHSKDSYKSVQRLVRSANIIELYTDVSRLVPPEIRPEPVMCEVEQPPFDPRPLQRAAPTRAKPKRTKKAAAAQAGTQQTTLAFCSANELRRTRRDEHREGDDEEDEAPPPSRSSERIANLSDDSDDAEIASGLRISSSGSAYTWPTSTGKASSPTSAGQAPSPASTGKASPAASIGKASAAAPGPSRAAMRAPVLPRPKAGAASPPAASLGPPHVHTHAPTSGAPQRTPSIKRTLGARRSARPPAPLPAPSPPAQQQADAALPSPSPAELSDAWHIGSSPAPLAQHTAGERRFAPHPLVAQLAEQASDSPPSAREAARPASAGPAADEAARAQPAPLFLLSQESDADADEAPIPMPSSSVACAATASSSLRVPSSPPRPPARRKRRRTVGQPSLFVEEAERETDSDVHGESDEDDSGPGSSDENEEDRAAVGDFVATQHDGYNQEAIYLQSLLSQRAPTPFRGRDRLQELLARRRALQPSSEVGHSDDDAYSNDSFVVGDDEISWMESSDV